ncbi:MULTISPECIES: TetR/AcrR family transcriptional regulator [Gordonia]|uniref:TetR/AcrR family transcriptional regulator n=2 Tax=Gordonia TaxID=2053 RepID=A0ABT6BWF8_9ACTN|nr:MULTISPECIES: TetR/AcrR family transcriptional regulator [Gordonia]MBN0971837.1 TetR/AcrR family transcriptional regulator [Gordonia sp. BP-119]MBN0981637.1 TetR/AcrR family transcriptional regulator [Gordonia sp. BP-94]MBR7192061.1 TetR/AcrR family transcriptional regulator [Gordonia sp. SCSIO 19800]MDF6102274.1 TetR/AcrR family transcriptional regulator [Gordonia hongkongensis]WGJ87358.1 TetR/AcrR family transcriptional regulator [Gordonia sp. SMJS1]
MPSSPPSDPDEPARVVARLRPLEPRSLGQRSAQIVRAATRLFQDAGFRNVSIEQIGAAVGLTGPAVYRHFPGKHDILSQALTTQVELVATLMADAEEHGRSPVEQLALLLDGLGDLTAHRDVSTLWRREQRHLQPAELDVMRGYFAQLSEHFAALVAAARPDVAPSDAAMLGAAALSVYSNTSGMRGSLSPARLMEVQRAVADSILACRLPGPPEPDPDAERAPAHRRPASRRERILDAATQLFSERGFPDVRIDEIARTADVSIATLYQEVSGKSDLLLAVLWRGVQGILYVTAHALSRAGSDDPLDVLIRVFVEYALDVHGRIMPVFTSDLMYLPDTEQTQLRNAQTDYRAEWIDAIRSRNPLLTAADANALAQALFGYTCEIIESPQLRSRPGVTAELETIARAILNPAGLRGAPPES